eukprot:gene8172-1428_t
MPRSCTRHWDGAAPAMGIMGQLEAAPPSKAANKGIALAQAIPAPTINNRNSGADNASGSGQSALDESVWYQDMKREATEWNEIMLPYILNGDILQPIGVATDLLYMIRDVLSGQYNV